MTTDTMDRPRRSFNRFHFWALAYLAISVVGATWLNWSLVGCTGFLVIGNVWWLGGELVIELRRRA